MKRSAWAEINLDNLSNNINEIKRVKALDTRIMAVIKANAYGHGAIQVAKRLREEGVDFFAVALLSEALELKGAGIDEDILILGYVNDELISKAIENDFILTVYNYKGAEVIAEIAKSLKVKARIHIKVDTGMNRLGFRLDRNNLDLSIDEIASIDKMDFIEVDGYFTHLATSDERDKSYSRYQLESFMALMEVLEQRGVRVRSRHISNSAAIIDMPEFNLDIVRPGIMLYGYYPSEQVSRDRIDLKPVMTMKSNISNIKWIGSGESVGYGRAFISKTKVKVGTVPIGYADGFTRLLSEKIYLNVGDKKAKLIGNICMDQSMIDCSGIEDVCIGDEVTIFGEGKGVNTADDLARAIGTINYEILCMVSKRVPRVYLSGGFEIEVSDYLLG